MIGLALFCQIVCSLPLQGLTCVGFEELTVVPWEGECQKVPPPAWRVSHPKESGQSIQVLRIVTLKGLQPTLTRREHDGSANNAKTRGHVKSLRSCIADAKANTCNRSAVPTSWGTSFELLSAILADSDQVMKGPWTIACNAYLWAFLETSDKPEMWLQSCQHSRC